MASLVSKMLAQPEELSVSISTEEASLHSSDVLKSADHKVPILMELVGASKLSSDDNDMDDKNMKVFGIIKFGNDVIHQTSKAIGTDPIWPISSRSLCIFEASARDLHTKNLQVTLWAKKKDPLNITTLETVFLGQATVDSKTIVSNCNEERLEVDLVDPGMHNFEPRGAITLRFRIASASDEAFVGPKFTPNQDKTTIFGKLPSAAEPLTSLPCLREVGQKPLAKMTTEVDQSEVAGESFVNAISSAFTSKSYFDASMGAEMVKVKPSPDPAKVDQTTYLTKRQLSIETRAPSTNWVQAGGGGLGKLYLEILSCHDLPNVDVGEAVGNVTDCFVAAVFEDAMVQTPVIDDELSPHWLPWTQRAFIFGIMHPASILYLGAFDFDLGITDHEALGRVAVNISNLQCDTDYTLKYNLYPSSNVTDRTANGCITIRLRIEYDDEKAALLEALKPRPKFHVNVKKEKSLKIVHYACYGEYGDENDQQFDLTVMRSLVNEIFEYKSAVSYAIGDAMRSLIFWRGQVKFGKVYLPLHSLGFFIMATTLVERPYMAPAFFLLSIAWIMLAAQNQRTQHPSPWYHCPSFWQYLQILKTGKCPVSTRRINPNAGAEEAAAYDKKWQDRIEKDLKNAAAKAEMQQQIAAIGDDNIHSKIAAGGIPLDILARLGRYQGMIAKYLRYLRLVKIVATWEESIVSFWITAGFLSAGLASLLLPWSFILLWVGRISVWGMLGPHMFLVDLFMRSGGDDEKVLADAVEKFQGDSRLARYRKQDAVKLKDMKCLAFGNFISLVPNFNLVRHYDRPLPASFARLRLRDEDEEGPTPKSFIPSQQFFGTMVPRTETLAKDFEAELRKLAGKAKNVQAQIELLARIDRELSALRMRDGAEDEVPDCIGFEVTGEHGGRAQIKETDSEREACEYADNDDATAPKEFGYEIMGNGDSRVDENVLLRVSGGASLVFKSDSKRAVLNSENGDYPLPLRNTSKRVSREEIPEGQAVEILLSSTLEHNDTHINCTSSVDTTVSPEDVAGASSDPEDESLFSEIDSYEEEYSEEHELDSYSESEDGEEEMSTLVDDSEGSLSEATLETEGDEKEHTEACNTTDEMNCDRNQPSTASPSRQKSTDPVFILMYND